jgi:hypothetical protein
VWPGDDVGQLYLGFYTHIESEVCRELSVNGSAFQAGIVTKVYRTYNLEPYLCRESCSPFHSKSCLLCLSYLYSRPTFPGNGANLCGDTLTVSLHHVKSVVRTF